MAHQVTSALPLDSSFGPRAPHDLSRRELVSVALGAGLAAACSSDDALPPETEEMASREAKAAYPKLSPTTIKGTYGRTLPDGKTGRYQVAYVGEKSTPAGTFHRYRSTRSGAASGAELWVNPKGKGVFELGGAEFSSENAAALKVASPATITLAAPVVVDLGAPVGVPQAATARGDVALAGKPVVSAEAKGTYTVVARGVSVEGPQGLVVAGCTQVRIEAEVPIFFGATSLGLTAEIWYSETLGVVRGDLGGPLAGFGWGVKGSRGSHELGDGYVSVEAMDIVGKGASASFELSTREAHGVKDADKDSHAKMLVELRWADDAMAKTDKRPSIDPVFGTDTGMYSATLEQVPVSFLHPEENGKGYVYWYYYVDQAAKNQPVNGIEYHAGVRYDSSFSPLRITARIVYKKV